MIEIKLDIIIYGEYVTLDVNAEQSARLLKENLMQKYGLDPKATWHFTGADGVIIDPDWKMIDVEKYRPQPFYLSLAPGVGA